MKKILLINIILLLAFTSNSCMSRKSWFGSSTKHSEEKINKVFVYMNIPNDQKYANSFIKCLQSEFEQKHIACDYYLQQKLDLINSQDLQKMVSDYGATHIISINKHSSFDDGAVNYVSFTISLSNSSTGRSIWDGILNLDLRLIKNTKQTQNDATILIKELVNNKLL